MATNKKLLKGLITLAIGLMLSGAVAVWQGFSLSIPAALMARTLSDGFFVAGLLFTGLGALVWVSTTGFFDIFTYAGKSLLVLFSPMKQPEKLKKFYEYKADKDEKRKKADFTLLIVGAAYLLLSFAFLGGYYAMMGA